MKFPSINQLIFSLKKVLLRFPIPIIYALIATISGFVLSYYLEDVSAEKFLVKGIYLGNFGLALSLALCFYKESKGLKTMLFFVGNLFIFLILLLIFFTIDTYNFKSDIILLLILGFAFHLLVAFSAFHTKEDNNGFWQINKTLFLQFATSVLFSAVLFIGLSVALLSIQTLFDINWDGKVYFRLWIIIAGLFNTIFFLASIHQPLNQLNQDTSYPKGLKVFTQYVLIPLASVYLAILLAYELKIIFQWSLPNSSVAILILGYAVFGILSILLVHPLRNQEGNKWIQLFSKSFYLLMLPLLLLLAVSIIKRVSDYGITESRYLIIALAIWLTFITIFFLIKGREQIRVIPISLFFFAISIVFGPWSILSVSKNSQVNRLAYYLDQKPSPKRNNEVRNLVSYIYNYHGYKELQPLVKSDLETVNDYFTNKVARDSMSRFEEQRLLKDSILSLLNVDPNYEMVDNLGVDTNTVKNFKNSLEGELDVNGALKVVAFYSTVNNSDKKKIEFKLDGQQYELKIDSSYSVHLKSSAQDEIVFKADSLLKSLQNNKSLKLKGGAGSDYAVLPEMMSISKEIKSYKVICRFERLNGGVKSNVSPYTVYYNGFLIFYPKK